MLPQTIGMVILPVLMVPSLLAPSNGVVPGIAGVYTNCIVEFFACLTMFSPSRTVQLGQDGSVHHVLARAQRVHPLVPGFLGILRAPLPRIWHVQAGHLHVHAHGCTDSDGTLAHALRMPACTHLQSKDGCRGRGDRDGAASHVHITCLLRNTI